VDCRPALYRNERTQANRSIRLAAILIAELVAFESYRFHCGHLLFLVAHGMLIAVIVGASFSAGIRLRKHSFLLDSA
jgi:hypothetical protein